MTAEDITATSVSPVRERKPPPPTKSILCEKKAPKAGGLEHSIEDEGDDINSAVVISDSVAYFFDSDDEQESTIFILGLAATGVIFPSIGYVCNMDNGDVQMGIYFFMVGYAVLLLRIMPFWLTAGGMGCLLVSVSGNGTTLLLWLSLVLLGIGLSGYLIRYLVPQSIMRILKKLSWVLLFVGSHIMISSGAEISGGLCMVVSALWFLLFLIRYICSKLSGRVHQTKNVGP